MGRSASARAKELFGEDVVMGHYEALFADLEQRRLAVSCGKPVRGNLFQQVWIRSMPLMVIPAIPANPQLARYLSPNS